LIARFQGRFGFSELSNPASLTLIALAFSIFSFFFSPIINGYSRYIEHEADIFGLNQTRDGNAAARAFKKLADQNLRNPNPSAFINSGSTTIRPWRSGLILRGNSTKKKLKRVKFLKKGLQIKIGFNILNPYEKGIRGFGRRRK